MWNQGEIEVKIKGIYCSSKQLVKIKHIIGNYYWQNTSLNPTFVNTLVIQTDKFLQSAHVCLPLSAKDILS